MCVCVCMCACMLDLCMYEYVHVCFLCLSCFVYQEQGVSAIQSDL